MPVVYIILVLLAALFGWGHYQKYLQLRRIQFVRAFELPPQLFAPLREQHPELTTKDFQLIGQGLRQFFLAYLRSGRRYVSMPSQAVDEVWHEFILHTRAYEQFCQKAFGRFLHHSPAESLSLSKTASTQSDAGLRRVWWHACKEENINPHKPSRLPLLFALDAKLKFPNGFFYVTDCKESTGLAVAATKGLAASDRSATVIYCGGDLASSGDINFSGNSSGCGSDSAFTSDSGGSGSDSGGSGCSGSGCSGGCGGGGGGD